jgi:SEC-C motif domain protein
VEDGEVSLVLLVPPSSAVIPEQLPGRTAAGNVSLKKVTQAAKADYYKHFVCGHDCCGPVHRGESTPATAEALMRCRYSAFARSDAAYLHTSWHPSTRPDSVELDPRWRWTRLRVLATEQGGADDLDGTVQFRAHYRDPTGEPGMVQECSRFVRVEGRWLYLDARPEPE